MLGMKTKTPKRFHGLYIRASARIFEIDAMIQKVLLVSVRSIVFPLVRDQSCAWTYARLKTKQVRIEVNHDY